MASKIDIANRALSKCGAARITSFSENSTEARTISSAYDIIRDALLGENLWTFATKRAQLATVVSTPLTVNDNVSVVYSKPSDMIKIFFVSDPSATVKVEGNQILSNVSNLKCLYVYQNDDPGTYFAQFVDAFATRLASEICFELSQSSKKASLLWDDYEKVKLPRAISSDSQQGTPIQPMQDEWLTARSMNGPGFYAAPGAQVWHPLA